MRLKVGRERVRFAVNRASEGLSSTDLIFGGRARLRLLGDDLTIVGRDNSTTVSVSISVEGQTNGDVCVDHGRLSEFLQRALGQEVQFSLAGKNLKLRSASTDIVLPVFPLQAGEFALPELPRVASTPIRGPGLAITIRRVLAAAHEDAKVMPLCGVHLAGQSGRFLAEATDSQRMARASEQVAFPTASAIVGARFASKLAEIAQAEESVALRFGSDRVWAEVPGTRLVGSMFYGDFPSLPIAAGTMLASARCKAEALASAIAVLRIVDEAAWVSLQLGSERIKLSAKGAEGAAANCPIECERRTGTATAIVGLNNLRRACASLEIENVLLSVVQLGESRIVRLEQEGGAVVWQLACRVD